MGTGPRRASLAVAVARAAVVVAITVAAGARADTLPRVLAAIELTAPATWKLTPGVTYTARLTADDPEALRAALAGAYEVARDGATVRVRVAGYAPLAGAPGDEQRKPSFLIDYDEPVFAKLRATVEDRFGAHPTPEQLAGFVNGYIANKNMQRGDDIASTVATRREGDCTEHAVLLAALVRLFGGGARVVGGVALLDVDHRPYAFGHAWVEIAEGKRWRPLDATRPTERPDGRWLPIEVTRDESMRYRAAAIRKLRIWPSRLVIE
jgi:transglutaminase-like putative cysteine protease